jgi:hypothetical protein
VVRLIDHHDLEPLLRRQIHLLRLRDFLEQVLYDDAVVVAHIGRCDLEVVDGGDNVELELAVRRGLEDARVDFDLFDAWAVELFERGDDAGLLAGTRGAVDEEVGEVAALGLDVVLECNEACSGKTYEGPKTLGELGMVAEGVECARAVFIYEERHDGAVVDVECLYKNLVDRRRVESRVRVGRVKCVVRAISLSSDPTPLASTPRP